MPATRLANRRRKSSYGPFMPAKAGTYGVAPSPRSVTFAPNVTPISYNDSDSEDDALILASSSNPDVQALASRLFPPSTEPTHPPSRKRCPPGKRLSQGYIPRPPNAFMLFRADFVRQKHVPGSIETTHGSLSKIIGACWKQLPLEEKRVWEIKAKQEKVAHKAKYPDYRFRPVHNKNKNKDQEKKGKTLINPEDEQRCEDVAHLLLTGKKGEDLARAVRILDRARSMEREQPEDSFGLESFAMPMPISASQFQLPFPITNQNTNAYYGAYQRRASSVPLPNEWFASYPNSNTAIALPSISNFMSRAASPVHSISRYTQANQTFDNLTNPFYPQYTPTNAEFPLFAPTPQASQFQFSSLQTHTQTTPRSSLGLGQRRASSAQPMGTMRRPLSWSFNAHALPDFSTFDFAAIQGGSGMMMERDPSPLPEVEEGLFSNFSFDSTASTSNTSVPSTEVDPATLLDLSPAYEELSRIQTSFASSLSSSSPSSSAASTAASSSTSGSPAPSMSDVLPEINDMAVAMGMTDPSYMGMTLDGLYAANAMFTSHSEQGMEMTMRLSYVLGMHGTGMEIPMDMFEDGMDPVESNQKQHSRVSFDGHQHGTVA